MQTSSTLFISKSEPELLDHINMPYSRKCCHFLIGKIFC